MSARSASAAVASAAWDAFCIGASAAISKGPDLSGVLPCSCQLASRFDSFPQILGAYGENPLYLFAGE